MSRTREKAEKFRQLANDSLSHNNFTGVNLAPPYKRLNWEMSSLQQEMEIAIIDYLKQSNHSKPFHKWLADWLEQYRFNVELTREYGKCSLDRVVVVKDKLIKLVRFSSLQEIEKTDAENLILG